MYDFLPDTGVGALPEFIVRPSNQNKIVVREFFNLIRNDNVIGD